MRILTFAALLAAVVISYPLSFAKGQSALERFAVPKAKLIPGPWQQSDAGSTTSIDHSVWDAFLAKYVKSNDDGINLVRYSAVSSDNRAALNAYLADLQKTDVTKLNRDEQFAFWVNLYNATTVSVVLQNYPLKSIRDVKNGILDFLGPFNDKLITVNGQSLSLNDIESGIVRPLWPDPRLHYVFNCAAISCPNLGLEALKGDILNEQLDEAAVRFVNDRRAISFSGDKVTASKIYFWYQDDFGGSHQSILDHMKRYAGEDLQVKLRTIKKFNAFEYDWALNEAG